MASRAPETDPKAQLGELLRLARELTPDRKTQEVVAKIVGVERSTVGKGEQGDRVPNVHTLGLWLDALGVEGLARTAIEKMHKLARFADEDAPVRIWFAGYLDAEGKAHTIRIWQPLIVPGLLQTEAYAAELFRAMGRGTERATADVEARMSRQAILDRPDPPTVIVLLWEPVLHHQIGTPEVMRDQIARVLELADRGVLVHVLPSSEGANSGLGGPISLATGHGSEVVLTGSLLEDVVTADRAQVRAASATFERVRANAANLSDSRQIVLEAHERWNKLTTGGRRATAATAEPTA
jgi:transcriptional regulator with XRE-family HTH domain